MRADEEGKWLNIWKYDASCTIVLDRRSSGKIGGEPAKWFW
jgi:hypothetical protein